MADYSLYWKLLKNTVPDRAKKAYKQFELNNKLFTVN